MKKIKIWDLLIYVLSAELAGVLSGIAAGGNFREFYDTLAKPPLAPPGLLFPIAWAVLYALMGIAAYIVSSSDSINRTKALILYGAQLFVNVIWSPVFFGLQSFAGAAVIAVVLALLVAYTVLVFAGISRCSAVILIPYLLWSVYAAYLSIGTLILNG